MQLEQNLRQEATNALRMYGRISGWGAQLVWDPVNIEAVV